MSRFAALILLGTIALVSAGASSPVQTVAIDAVYSGTAGWHVLSWPRSSFGASTENASAPSGLTTAYFSSEGFVNIFGNLEYSQAGDLGGVSLYGTNGDVLAALYTLSAQGTAYRYGGSFTITHGGGRFVGATGRGTFLLEAGEYKRNQYGGFEAPATLTIRGKVNAPAIPEPGTLTLIASSLPGLAGLALRKQRAVVSR
ncbi:MAG TPA: PEP-CTERM sorting domain-containing protein [Armatimonadota bacterium]